MKYTVKKGDTLSSIALKYGTTTAKIKTANSTIKDINKIYVGQIIEVPTTSATKNYAEIGKQLEKCLKDIENLSSFKKLVSML